MSPFSSSGSLSCIAASSSELITLQTERAQDNVCHIVEPLNNGHIGPSHSGERSSPPFGLLEIQHPEVILLCPLECEVLLLLIGISIMNIHKIFDKMFESLCRNMPELD